MIDGRPVMVRSVTPESDRRVSLRLGSEDAAPMPDWQPGADVDLRLPGFVRSYFLVRRPLDLAHRRAAREAFARR
jgi:ferredoxin-NADP reductase